MELSLLAMAKYTRPLASMATAGSALPEDVIHAELRTDWTFQVAPLSCETTTAPPLLQLLFGTYTVPSGATLTCPCMPTHCVRVYSGTEAPKVNPPSSLREQNAVARSCEQ